MDIPPCVFSLSLSFIYSSNKNTPSWPLNLSTDNFVDFERDSWLARDWEKPRRESVNSYSRIDDRSVGMRSQRHVSHLAELLRFPFDRPRRLCVTKNRVFTCTSWPTSPSKRSLLRAFSVARKRDPPRQRFPSRGSGHWQKKTGELLFHVGRRAERVAQKEKSFLLRIQVLALESEETIRWKDTASFPLLLLI